MDSQQNQTHTRKLVFIFVVGVTAILTFALISPYVLGLTAPYRQFARKSDNYYSHVAGTCDLILQQHPIGTNTFISIPVNDVGIPKIVKDLRPTEIEVQPNRVWMRIGESRPGFGIAWELDEGRSNYWRLKTYADGLELTHYSETKHRNSGDGFLVFTNQNL